VPRRKAATAANEKGREQINNREISWEGRVERLAIVHLREMVNSVSSVGACRCVVPLAPPSKTLHPVGTAGKRLNLAKSWGAGVGMGRAVNLCKSVDTTRGLKAVNSGAPAARHTPACIVNVNNCYHRAAVTALMRH